jgi:hypothetical protein
MNIIYYITGPGGPVFHRPIVGTEEQMDQIVGALRDVCCIPIGLSSNETLDAGMVLNAVRKYAATEDRSQGLRELPDPLRTLPFYVDFKEEQ